MGVFIEICRIISYSFLIYFQSFHFMPHIKKSHSLCYEILNLRQINQTIQKQAMQGEKNA